MKKVFLDTNISLDLLLNREPHSANAEMIYILSARKEIALYVSSLSLPTIYYFLEKSNGHKAAMFAIYNFRHAVNLLRVETVEIDLALKADMADFEDAIQYFNAKENGMDFIITRNEKDFPKSTKALYIENPTQFLKRFK